MSDVGYLIWLIVSAVLTVAVLTIGTLGAADLLPARVRGPRRSRRREDAGRGGRGHG